MAFPIRGGKSVGSNSEVVISITPVIFSRQIEIKVDFNFSEATSFRTEKQEWIRNE